MWRVWGVARAKWQKLIIIDEYIQKYLKSTRFKFLLFEIPSTFDSAKDVGNGGGASWLVQPHLVRKHHHLLFFVIVGGELLEVVRSPISLFPQNEKQNMQIQSCEICIFIIFHCYMALLKRATQHLSMCQCRQCVLSANNYITLHFMTLFR